MFGKLNRGPSQTISPAKIACALIVIIISNGNSFPHAIGYVSAKRAEQIRRAENLAKVSTALFQRLLKSDNGIPTNILNQSKAIAVFPVVSNRKGFFRTDIRAQGVISRRVGPTVWTAPAFFEITRSTTSGLKGATSTVVVVFKEDNAIDKLRTSNFGSLKDLNVQSGPVKENGKEPTLKTNEPLYTQSDAFYYEYIDGVPVTPNTEDGSIKSKDSYNNAVYELDSGNVLFGERDKAIETARSNFRATYSFIEMVNTLPANNEITPQANEFFDAGYDYSIEKSLDTIKGHMKYYFSNQGLAYREEVTDDGILITAFRDLEERGRRFRRTAFKIKINRTNEEYNCNVQFRWHVSSRGKDERVYKTTDEDKTITADDVLLNQYIQQIHSELEKLKER
jgi:lipid-binding SYLF domain-containing protein